MIILDHNTLQWLAKRKTTNGAETYSKDLVQYQIPHWRQVLGDDDIISVCPKFSTVAGFTQHPLAVQYLHTFPYKSPMKYVKDIMDAMVGRATSLVFVTAYAAYAKRLNRTGINAVFVPMSIDFEAVARFEAKPIFGYKRMLWFGNIYKPKIETFKAVRAACARKGIRLDVLERDSYNGRAIRQEQVLPIVAKYSQVVAVGRCALESYALGVKVLIAGNGVGGVVLNSADAERQSLTNFNARTYTQSRNIDKCLQLLPSSLTNLRFDIKQMNHAEMVMKKILK